MTSISEIEILIRARYPLIWIESYEEQRVIRQLHEIAMARQKQLILWSGTTGLINTESEPVGDNTKDPIKALDFIESIEAPTIVVYKDLHRYIDDIRVYRKVRDLHTILKGTMNTMMILAPVVNIPVELQKSISVVSIPLPTANDLDDVLTHVVSCTSAGADKNSEIYDAITLIKEELVTNKEEILNAGLGLTEDEFENVISRSMVEKRNLDPKIIIAEKEQIIRKSGILEFQTEVVGMDQVGGLNVLKDWIMKRKLAYTPEAKEYGLPVPKGVFITGPPGTGKTLTAKAASAYLGVPLLRLDIAKIFGSFVGQSEQNISQALKLAEAVAPCVTGDTKIVCGDGSIMTAESLYDKAQLNQRVVAMDSENQLWTVPLIGVIKKKAIDGLYKITTTASTIQVTGNHKLMTDCGWVEAKTLCENDWLYMPHLKAPAITPIDVCDLMPSDAKKLNDNTWRSGRGGWTDSKLTINCKTVIEEFAELLGYIDSDGSMNVRGRISFYNSDVELLDRFDELIKNIFNLQPRRILNSNGPGDVAIKRNGESITTRKIQYVSYINNTLLVKVLTNLRNNLLIFNYADLIPAYIRAFVNGDGNIDSKQGRITISQKSKEYQELITELLRRMGIFGRFRMNNVLHSNPKATQNLTLSGEMARKLLDQLSNASGPTNDKISRANFIKTQFTHTNGRAIRINENGVISRIESIELIPDKDVFDLSCLKLHNYVSNGFVSHNCVLWLDEIEKAMAGVQSSGTNDSGVTARVFGTFLTWLQEHTAPVFVVATCNNPVGIPPEIYRSGRFDEVFFVNLPSEEERVTIFDIHIAAVGRDPAKYDVKAFAKKTKGYSGAEIQGIIYEAMYNSFFMKINLDGQEIFNAIDKLVPLSKKRENELNQLITWGLANALDASDKNKTSVLSRGREGIEII